MTRSLSVLALLLLAGSASAQIATDRPGLGFNASTVGRGVVQVEAGLPQAIRSNAPDVAGVSGSSTTYQFPALVRYGVTDAVELRLGTPSLYDVNAVSVDTPAGGVDESDGDAGLDLVEVGAKVQVTTNGPVISILPSVLIPTTEAGDFAATARAVAGWTLTDRLGLTTVLGGSYLDGDPDGQVVAEAIAVLGTSLANALSVYVEIGAFPGDDTTPVLAGGGLTFLVTPDFQLDASFDAGLNDSAPDLLFGAGASVRF